MVFVLPTFEEEKEKFILPDIEKKEVNKENNFKLPFDVMKGSVIDKFDDQGNEITKPIIERVKDFFTSKDDEIYKEEYTDPVLKAIYDVEKKYSMDNYYSLENFTDQVLYKTNVGMIRDVTQGTIDFANYIMKKFPGIDNNVIDYKLPVIPEPEYFGGSFARDLSGFYLSYRSVAGAGNIAKIPEATSKTMKSFKVLMTGGLAEQFAFSPREKRLSTIVETYKDGKFSNAVTAYLQAVDTDSEDAARAKMFAEGSIIGIPLELLSWAVRGGSKINKKNIDEGTIEIATKEINDIKVLSNKKIIKLTSRLDEINKLKKELKEVKSTKPKKNTTEIIKDGKKIKTIVTDEKYANEIANKKAAILKKLKPLEVEEKIFEATQSNKVQEAFEYKFPKPRTLDGLEVPLDLTTPQLKLKVTKQASKAAEEIITAAGYKVNPYLRITEQMADVFNTSKVSDETIIKILKKNNLTQEKFAKIFLNNFSDAGRTLQVASTISKKINQLRKLPGADEAWKQNVKNYVPDAFDRTGNMIKRLDNIKRGLLVTQIATAMRNFESQSMRQGVAVLEETFDAAFQQVFKSMFKDGKPVRIADPINSLQGFLKIFSQLNPKIFKKVKAETADIMASFPKEDDRLFLRFSSDVLSDSSNGGGLFKKPLDIAEQGVNYLNFVNKFQEFITRRAVFQARLNSIIKSNPTYYGGKNLNELVANGQTNIIRRQDVAQSVDAALEITYAKSFNANAGKGAPYEAVAGTFINLVNKLPFTATSVIPFPRFMMNSLRFHFDFSPLGFLNFLNKSERAAFARGDTSKLSRAVIGMAMLSGAYYLRHQPYAGEKWYEIKMGGKTYDTRAYNPFAAYLFVGDLFKRYKEGTLRGLDLKGFASVFLGTRGGTGLYLIDKLIDGLSKEKVVADPEKIINNIIGSQVSAFLTPLTMFNDFMTINNPDYNIVRDARGEKWGQVIKKVSPLDLPPIYSATSIEYTKDGFAVAKTIRREDPIKRQLTGFTVISEKNSAEKELDRLGFLPQEIFRSTGIAELDKAIKMELAPMIAIGMSNIVEQQWYKSMSTPVQTYFLKTMLNEFKAQVRLNLPDSGVIPYLLEYKLNTMPNDKRKVIDDILGKDFIPNLIEQQHEKFKTKDKEFVLPKLD